MPDPFQLATVPAPLDEVDTINRILGHLNFSSGSPEPGFRARWNHFYQQTDLGRVWSEAALLRRLTDQLESLVGRSASFADVTQADAVVRLVFEQTLPAYRQFHADLLFHLDEKDFLQPFFVAEVCEAVLQQGPPWNQTDRIVTGAIETLNCFIGYRPVAVLENGREMKPYSGEYFCPFPLFLRGSGIVAGPYAELIEQVLVQFEQIPADILQVAHFRREKLDELALDLRAHDHLHPVNKRTNYMFGEWDPHLIDTQGFYRRFVLRPIILDSLIAWIDENDAIPHAERLHDAAAVLCGTMLMASSVSGDGPETHDSSVTLTSLLPQVARLRDVYYSRLLDEATGARARRLKKEAARTQQPFGHVRQYLNICLAKYGAQQVVHRHLAQFYARIGREDAAQTEANVIPALSTRMECELQCRITDAHRALDRGELEHAGQCIEEIEELLQRGTRCGALIDPWNILGFQGQFPLFSSREDAIPDQRVETLLEFMEQVFGVYARLLCEAASQQQPQLLNHYSNRFLKLADDWDRYASTVVADLPRVVGRESWESARHVAESVAAWRNAGEAAGDISFWKQYVERFQSAKSYALVIDELLRKGDHIASLGLLMQWLSQADFVGLNSGPYAFSDHMFSWLKVVTSAKRLEEQPVESWNIVRKMFDYLEANAADYWSVPDWGNSLNGISLPVAEEAGLPYAGEDDEDFDDEDSLFDAAYDNIVFRDSAEDGFEGETLDGGFRTADTEFELMARSLEPRMTFLNTLAEMWRITAECFSPTALSATSPAEPPELPQYLDTTYAWYRHTESVQRELEKLTKAIWHHGIDSSSGDHDANVEYDIQLQSKLYLLHTLVTVSVNWYDAQRALRSTLPAEKLSEAAEQESEFDQLLSEIYRKIELADAAAVRKRFPLLLKMLAKRPLLYVPFERGGHPQQVLQARTLQNVIRHLLSHLPYLGLFRECWHLLKTAHQMERTSRPKGGMAVSEFDRLFRTALQSSLEALLTASANWKTQRKPAAKDKPFTDQELLNFFSEISERYLELWLKHSRTMRLSAAEALQDDEIFEEVKAFIEAYGADLFHAKYLTLGNVRAILHTGIESFLGYLDETEDPLHRIKLLDDLRDGVIDFEQAIRMMELIYEVVVDKFERFLEYNTTTTQSDYGDQFFCLLDFLRVESGYDREAWNMAPVGIAHEVLARGGRDKAAEMWERTFEERSSEHAERHLRRLSRLEKKYGVRIPSLADHLNERFVKPLAVNRMLALVPHCLRFSEQTGEIEENAEAFAKLQAEIEQYQRNTVGAGIDVPEWLRSLDQEADKLADHLADEEYQAEASSHRAAVQIKLQDLKHQLTNWKQPL